MSLEEQYAREVPEEIKRAINATDNETRLGILVALLKHGEMTFSQLKEMTRLNQSTFNSHLKILMKSALITNYFRKRIGVGDYSYYDVTDFGEAFLDGLYGSLEIEPRISILRRGGISVTENKSVVLESVSEEEVPTRMFVPPLGTKTQT